MDYDTTGDVQILVEGEGQILPWVSLDPQEWKQITGLKLPCPSPF